MGWSNQLKPRVPQAPCVAASWGPPPLSNNASHQAIASTMPNWNRNFMTIACAPSALVILDGITNGKGQLDFETIVQPPGEPNLSADERLSWNRRHWGTNCNPLETELVQKENCGQAFTFSFQTAWGPPLPIAEAIATRYTNAVVMLHYTDCRCNAETDEGIVVWRHGKKVAHDKRQVPWSTYLVDSKAAKNLLHQ